MKGRGRDLDPTPYNYLIWPHGYAPKMEKARACFPLHWNRSSSLILRTVVRVGKEGHKGTVVLYLISCIQGERIAGPHCGKSAINPTRCPQSVVQDTHVNSPIRSYGCVALPNPIFHIVCPPNPNSSFVRPRLTNGRRGTVMSHFIPLPLRHIL